MRLRKGKVIPREDGKRIEEFVGAATTGTDGVSVARMLAPPGWAEPAQTPEFDEVVLVLKGELTLVLGGRRVRVRAGEVGLVPRGQRVVYRNDARVACDYWSVCAPAFRPQLAHVEPAAPAPSRNRVALEVAHAKGQPHGAALERLAQRYMKQLGLANRELSLTLCTDAAIRKVNREWRGKDQPTDVLSFPAGELPRGTPGPRPLGDVLISLDTARRQAKEWGRALEEELARYLAHGLLHLLGHDHHEPAETRRMAALEAQLLGASGMVGDAHPASRR